MTDTAALPPPSPGYPPRVALARKPLGILGSAMTARRNVLELIPELALRQPMVSGTLGIRWHMVMDPAALRRVLKDRVEDYPKSTVTKLLLPLALAAAITLREHEPSTPEVDLR